MIEFFKKLPGLKSGIGRRFILYILIFSSIITFIGTGLQLYLDFDRDLKSIHTIFKQIESSYLDSITNSLWVTDNELLQIQLEGILRLPDMQLVEVRKEVKVLHMVGIPQSENIIEQTIPLVYIYDGQDIHLGELHVIASLKGVYARIINRVLLILSIQTIKTFLVSLFIFAIFYQLVGKHILSIASFAESLSFESMDHPIQLDRKPKTREPDELDKLATSFNRMQENLVRDINRRGIAEKKLQESEERFRAVATNTPDHIIVQDLNLRYEWVLNPQLDLSEKDMIGKTDFEFLKKKDAANLTELKKGVLNSGNPKFVKIPLISSSGETQFFEGSYIPRHDREGKVNGLIGYFRNETEKIKSDEALRKNEEKLRLLFDHSPVGICTVDLTGNFVTTNPAYERMLGYSKKELRELSFFDVTHPNNRPKNKKLFQAMFSLETSNFSMKKIYIHKDGSEIDVAIHAIGIMDAEAKVRFGTAFVDDITERKRVEQALKESEERFRKISENAPVLINSFDKDGRCLFWNKQCNKTFGWTIEEINEQESSMALFYPDPAVCEEVIRTVTIDPDGSFREWHPVTKDGKILSMMWANFSLPNGQVFSMGHDITAQKQIEDALKKKTHDIGERIKELKCLYSISKLLENQNYLLGKTLQRIVNLIPPAWQYPEITCVQLTFRNNQYKTNNFKVTNWKLHCNILIAGKNSVTIDVYYLEEKPPIDEGPFLKEERALINEIAERVSRFVERLEAEDKNKQLEHRLQQSQKMESIGTLAGGVAHEINNPINGIMNYAQLIQDKIGEENLLSEYTSEIIHETERVSKIVKNLLAFARQEKESHSPARIKDIINDTMSLIQTVLKRDQIALVADISEDLPKIKCRSQQIQQVVMNLITNARDALNERYPDFDDNKKIVIISVFIEKDGRRWVRTTIEDRGLGIAPDTMKRMFDPFYTTKEKSEGTGLGLSISYGIVKDHNGELRVESEPGQYTRFHMDLPVNNGWNLPSSH